MSSKRTVVTPGAGSAYAAQGSPDVNPAFESNLMILSLEAGAEAQVSFNGLTDDVQLIAGVVIDSVPRITKFPLLVKLEMRIAYPAVSRV